jgi:murein DD-endopeptidase MepM/ murein hydrolase activator NlpD
MHVLASVPVSAGTRSRLLGAGTATLLLALSLLPLAGGAAGGEKLSDLKARMNDIQGELDAVTAEVQEAYARQEVLKGRLKDTGNEITRLQRRHARLKERAAERAAALYKQGTTGAVEILLTADDFRDLTDQAEILSRVSLDEAGVFVDLKRSEARLSDLRADLQEDKEELAETKDQLEDKVSRLESQFGSVSKEYEALKAKIAAAQQAPETPAPQRAPTVKVSGGMVCPVAGPTSFVDSYGQPRSGGRGHEGVDMMAARGTPQVAIVSGTITYAGYSGLGGNVQYLSGDDGHLYVYVHQDRNIVTGGRVSAGQTISTVGDSGNAAGTPHLHFEYHPGGGGAVNPTPLVASLC